MTVNVPAKTCPCTLFGDATPATSTNEGVGLELGVRFTPDATAVSPRCATTAPAAPDNASGDLWTTSGTRLAEVTFPAPKAGTTSRSPPR